ncbi:MAG TPA: Yip1 family protein [Thermoanaerobaculia bacterium]|nr:Yip1 family protein [Thermoanaerobaculia bacterium]
MPDETTERAGEVIPWERRSEMDLETAFAKTVAAFLHPRKAWDATPEGGGYSGPLIFAAVCGAVGSLFTAAYNLVLFQWMLRRNPTLRPPNLPWISGRALLPLSKINIVISPIVNGVVVTLFVFVVAAVIHAGVLLVGGRKRSTSGFERSFRVAAYGSAGLVGQVVPLVGSLIAFVWCLVLVFPGVARMHRMSLGRAVAALVLPFAILLLVMLAATSR